MKECQSMEDGGVCSMSQGQARDDDQREMGRGERPEGDGKGRTTKGRWEREDDQTEMGRGG